MKFTNRDGEIRFYDGSEPPFFLKIIFSGGDLSAPMGIPRAEEGLVLDRQRIDGNTSYVLGSEAALLNPLEITLSVNATSHLSFGHVLDWLDGMAVNGQTVISTKGTTRRDGTHFTPAFADPAKKCLNLEYRLDGPGGDLVWKYAEVYFPLSEVGMTEGDDGVRLTLKGLIYGTITRGTAFTAGTDVAL